MAEVEIQQELDKVKLDLQNLVQKRDELEALLLRHRLQADFDTFVATYRESGVTEQTMRLAHSLGEQMYKRLRELRPY